MAKTRGFFFLCKRLREMLFSISPAHGRPANSPVFFLDPLHEEMIRKRFLGFGFRSLPLRAMLSFFSFHPLRGMIVSFPRMLLLQSNPSSSFLFSKPSFFLSLFPPTDVFFFPPSIYVIIRSFFFPCASSVGEKACPYDPFLFFPSRTSPSPLSSRSKDWVRCRKSSS